MKKNYVFNSIDTSKIIIPKNNTSLLWKKNKKKIKKQKRLLRYKKKIPQKYKEYIKSKFWIIRKNQYFKKYGKKCMVCNSNKCIQLHHIEYNVGKFGFEDDKVLISLCRECHEEFHSIFGVKQNSQQDLIEFMEIKQINFGF